MYFDRLGALIKAALIDSGVDAAKIDGVRVERSTRAAHGDFGTPAALRYASSLGCTAMELATRLAERIGSAPCVEGVLVAEPGFVNVRLTADGLAQSLQEIVDGRERLNAQPQVLVEPSGEIEYLIGVQGRVSNLVRWAGSFGMEPSSEESEVLTPAVERALVCAVAEYPSIATAGKARLLVNHLCEIGDLLYRSDIDHDVLPKGDEIPAARHRTRLLLLAASEVVLSAGLRVLGYRPVERMYG